MGPEKHRRSPFRQAEFALLGATLADRILRRWEFRVSPQSQQNLEVHADALKIGSLVIYFNHLTKDDPFLIGFMALRRLKGLIRRVGGPIGLRHYEEFRSRSAPNRYLLDHLAPALGFDFSPVAQHYYAHEVPPEQQVRLNKDLLRKAKPILGNPGGLYLFAPEGTRSKDGRLQAAQPGVEMLHRLGKNVHYAPWAIVPLGQYDPEEGLGPVEVNIGRPQSKEEIEKENGQPLPPVALRYTLMANLAKLLPAQMRGAYSPNIP